MKCKSKLLDDVYRIGYGEEPEWFLNNKDIIKIIDNDIIYYKIQVNSKPVIAIKGNYVILNTFNNTLSILYDELFNLLYEIVE